MSKSHESTSDTVTIPRHQYEQLCEDAKFLYALEAAGVDNWDGYDEAREIFNA